MVSSCQDGGRRGISVGFWPWPACSIAAHLDIVEHAGIVKRADADLTMRECPVVGGHRGMLHVVKKDLDQPFLDPANESDMVPVVGPRGALGARLGNRNPGRAVDDENAIGMLVRRLAKMNIVKWLAS